MKSKTRAMAMMVTAKARVESILLAGPPGFLRAQGQEYFLAWQVNHCFLFVAEHALKRHHLSKPRSGIGLAVLHNYSLERVGDVFTIVGGCLQEIVNLF